MRWWSRIQMLFYQMTRSNNLSRNHQTHTTLSRKTSKICRMCNKETTNCLRESNPQFIASKNWLKKTHLRKKRASNISHRWSLTHKRWETKFWLRTSWTNHCAVTVKITEARSNSESPWINSLVSPVKKKKPSLYNLQWRCTVKLLIRRQISQTNSQKKYITISNSLTTEIKPRNHRLKMVRHQINH